MTPARGSADCIDTAEPWEKVLWRRQPYPDNHVPESFLAELRDLPPRPRPRLFALVIHALPITQHMAVIALFLSIFHALLIGRFSASSVGWAVVLSSVVGHFVRRLGWREQGLERDLTSHGLLPPTTSLRPLILPPLLLSLLSPVLGTLTSATTSDSIWPLAGCLLFIHVLLADFKTGPDARQKYRERRRFQQRQRRSSFHGDLEAIEEKSLSSSLSFTSALSASIVLASRLPSTAHVFSLILLAVSLFAGWPVVAKGVREAGQGFSILLTASTVLLAFSILPHDPSESLLFTAPSLIFLCTLLVVNIIGPLVFWWGWRWKTIRGGGWDVAVVRIRQATSGHG
ncbi:phosphatidylinositol N-acetylglucosaminyltransferase subunit C [Kockovaella imperatae]|uniref:Phosphatidylinositol N-acetylglucosaminyltransferase subunit C n=1 Tax=Kockovaella imperatae TaxID=4999 RepID=A0A1Y1UFX8_9TREE|nr:phosphatidylinositol N-acetylglucosaminyltransferase subunit C [Kockovaella imperatae]ORX36416.1 phosphatidylinositol N-acetylglucosaminyltransferase subunit C [Kockovaella imperatae]